MMSSPEENTNSVEDINISDLENDLRGPTKNSSAMSRENRELAGAFRMMAATRSPDKEAGSFGALAIRDDSYASALSNAKAIEKRVVNLIQSIGEIVLEAEAGNMGGAFSSPSKAGDVSPSHVRGDPVFEYFCEKSILSLFVDIAKEKRQGSEEGRRWSNESCYHGVVWSPLVKAQVFSTVAALVADGRNRSVLYYLLSHNHINELIQCVVPLHQWTDQALSIMTPAYVDMLQKIAVRLADDPQLFPFLTIEDEGEDSSSQFPLFSAVLETATGSYAQSDSVVYGTCLLVAVNIMQISYEPIQSWVCNAGLEQRRLADHLCKRLLDRYSRIVNLTTGPVVDGVRSNAISGQLAAVRDHMALIHEVFWSGIRGLDVRLCESLLQRVVTVLMKNLVTSRTRPFLTGVGINDSDVIPEREALAQVSTVFLSLLFTTLTYVPFQRMLAVALLHEKSTPLWSSTAWMEGIDSSESYIFMPLLSDIVTGDHERETCPNVFRTALTDSVSGKYGEWRTGVCTSLLQTTLSSEAMDDDSLRTMGMIPTLSGVDIYEATALEKAIEAFLSLDHKCSQVVSNATEKVALLGVQLLHRTLLSAARVAEDTTEKVQFILSNSPIWKALVRTRQSFAEKAKAFQSTTGVSDIFLDLVESAITAKYVARHAESGRISYRYPLVPNVENDLTNAENLVRRIRGVSPNDVETSRFYARMTLYFRALCKSIDRFCIDLRHTSGQNLKLDLVDNADDLIETIGGLGATPKIGSDLDLTGRMIFWFHPTAKPKDVGQSSDGMGPPDRGSRMRAVSEDMAFWGNTRLMLVLDPTDIYVVKPLKTKADDNRGTVLCTLSLRSVIAAAEDGDWLHVAVKHDDVGFLIKNGNMALQFENNGASLIVKQYLDRSREVLRLELLGKVMELLSETCAGVDEDSC